MNEKITAETIRRNARFFRTDIDMSITLTPAFLKDIAEAQNRFLYEIAERVEELEVKEEPVRHGHWVKNKDFTLMCSVCYEIAPYESNYYGDVIGTEKYPYCPHCGAKMDEVKA